MYTSYSNFIHIHRFLSFHVQSFLLSILNSGCFFFEERRIITLSSDLQKRALGAVCDEWKSGKAGLRFKNKFAGKVKQFTVEIKRKQSTLEPEAKFHVLIFEGIF